MKRLNKYFSRRIDSHQMIDIRIAFRYIHHLFGKKAFFIQSFFNQNVFLVIDYEIEIKGNLSKYFKTFILCRLLLYILSFFQ